MGIWDQTREFAARSRLNEERLHKTALDELSCGVRRDGLWAQALVAAAGDEKAAVAAYIKLRVTALRDEEHLLEAERRTAAPLDSDSAIRPCGADEGSYFDWRGFFRILGFSLAVISAIALLAALVS
jgi:hypothetical protein